MKNFIQDGKTLVITAGADLASGALVISNGVIGIAANAAKNGEQVVLHTEGVYELPKAAGTINPGDKVYWVAANSNITTTASGNTLIGRCWNSAQVASDATTAWVKLTPNV